MLNRLLEMVLAVRLSRVARRRRYRGLTESLEQRILLAWTATVTGTDIAMTGDAGTDAVTLTVVGGNLQHNIALSQGFASNQDFDNSVAGVQSVAAASLTSLVIDGGGGNNTVTLNGSTAHNYTAATSVQISNAALNVNQSLTLANGTLNGAGTTFAQAASAAISVGSSIDLNYSGALTFRNLVQAASITASSGSVSTNAILASGSLGVLEATAGDLNLTITSAAGGINFGSGQLTASGNVVLSSGTNAVSLLTVEAGGEFRSSGAGAFSAVAGSNIEASGAIDIDHTGTVTFRSTVQGGAIAVDSAASSVNAVLASGTAVVLTATTGDIVLTASAAAGGINFATGRLAAAGAIDVAAGTNAVALFMVDAGTDFESTGGGLFALQTGSILNAGGLVSITHGGTVTFRGVTEAGAISATSMSTSGNAFLANSVAGAQLTALNGDIELETDGGLNFAAGTLTTNNGNIAVTAGGAISLNIVDAFGAFTSTGGNLLAAAGANITAGGPVVLNHTGTYTVSGPVQGESIAITSTSTSANAIRMLGSAATLTSTNGDIILDALGGVTLQGAVTVGNAAPAAPQVPLSWGAVTDLANGVLGFDQLFTTYGASSTIAINGAEVIYTNPGGGGFDVGLRLVSPNNSQTGNTGSFGGAVTSGPLSTPHVYFNPWSGSNNTFYLEVAFYATGTSTPVDVLGFGTSFEDVERGASTREWLMGPQYKTSAGTTVDLDFSPASGFDFPTVAPDGSLSWMVQEIEQITTIYGETVYRAVPWYPVEGGTQANKNIGLNLATTPLSSFRIGTSKTGNGGSWLMGALGTIELANSSVPAKFVSSGTVFSSQNIIVGQVGSFELNHVGTKTIDGILDAGTYSIDGNGAMNVTANGGLTFYVNVQSPPIVPPMTAQLVKGGTGNLTFAAGSSVNVVATGSPMLAVTGMYTLAQNLGGAITGSTMLFATGPGASAVTSLLIGAPSPSLLTLNINAIP